MIDGPVGRPRFEVREGVQPMADDRFRYRTRDPTTGKLEQEFPFASDSEVRNALIAARGAFVAWSGRPIGDRLGILERVAILLEARSEEFARLMASEMGKPLAQGHGEVEKCAWVCRYYAENAEAFLRPREANSDGSQSLVRFEPIGPVLAIMPWNFPFWQVFRFVAPALALGNVALLKHAPSTPQCALAIEALLREAEAPDGVFQSLFLTHEQAASIVDDDAVRGMTLTGSTGAGREVASRAGRALKPMVMELGGSDPFLVFSDADLDRAVEQAVVSRCLNSGQSCIAAKRFLVEASVFDRFLGLFADSMRAQIVGDPRNERSDLGPLARADLRDRLAAQVDRALEDGAIAVCGGAVPDGPGYFFPPTVLTGIRPESWAAKEEFFGPVALVFSFRSEDEAVRLANATPYGLGSSLWTADRSRVARLVPRLEAGSVFVNGFVKSDPRLPFGGVKASGFGRELARDGLLEFSNRKTVWIS
ncbi:MAG: NAD-dependent succinate-semialdehyde dehydrogenase [Thermoanaerobaculia bacterium]|nr:NAD-dependent succinate-semialdehyde dehydrogenase [Thermoanaerobaculia bacterium]